ncbi:MAG: S41 family peptidase [Planctomycetes bacterium]|nr:S41 family peptidase [Planctomycetota bacterium]
MTPDDPPPAPPRPSLPAAARWALAGLLAAPLVVFLHQGSMLHVPEAAGANSLAAMAEVRQVILDRWVEPPDEAAITEGALRGMVRHLDEHSEFISEEQLAQFEEDTTGQFGGLGIYISLEEGLVVVISPIEDTPAFRAGILPGDVVLRIDGRPYEFATSSEAVAALKGAPGTRITLTVRQGDAAPRDVTLTREVIQVTSVKGTRLLDDEQKVGYVRITAFNSGTVDEFKAAAARLEAEGARALILDLRGNPGGYLHAATEVADLFLEKGRTIVETRARGPDEVSTIRAAGARRVALPTAVLIDGGSASASEILGGALADNGVATLVGQRSYGKGSVQSLISVLGGRAQLKLTTQHYFTPSGRRIHRGDLPATDSRWGLLPDVAVRLDPQLRQRLAQAEAERDMERLKALARHEDAKGPDERLHRDDPQVAAAHAHLVRVLAGEAKVGRQPAPPPDLSSAAPVDSATHVDDEPPPPYGE